MTAPNDAAIRQALPSDADAIAQLHVDVWEDAYSALMPARILEQRRTNIAERSERWRRQLDQSAVRTTVAEDASGLVGFASVGAPRMNDVSVEQELWALYVRASRWGTGVGHALLADALPPERSACLWVLRGNDRAVTFYTKHGFLHDGETRTDDYGTEVRMVRWT
jgi:GNAT superfamily N-acetyltransferase